MRIGAAIADVAGAERDLGRELWRVGERHPSDHDVFHLTKTLAGFCDSHLEQLAPHADRYSESIDTSSSSTGRGPVDKLVEKGGAILGRRPASANVLLGDLRKLHLAASRASIEWVMLAQGAQAVRDADLLATVSACHGETLRALKWTTYRIKTAAPQALAGG